MLPHNRSPSVASLQILSGYLLGLLPVASAFQGSCLVCASMSTFYVYQSLPSLHKQGYFPIQDTKFNKSVPELPPLRVKDLPPEAEHNLLVNIVKEMETSQSSATHSRSLKIPI
ncbi:hypothetical protein SOVF_013870 [Spinacia oleracea]|nr:hypothetical protein SOVF_013870 [Spinacia oleracea]